MGNTQGMNEEEVLSYYRGIAPDRWIDTLLNNAQTSGNFKKLLLLIWLLGILKQLLDG